MLGVLVVALDEPLVLVYTALGMVQVVGSLLVVAGAFATMAWWLAPLLVAAAVPALRTARHRSTAGDRCTRRNTSATYL